MGIETKRCFGPKNRQQRFFYRCDDCPATTTSHTAEWLLKCAFPKWLKFHDGRTFCPECIAKREKAGHESWGRFGLSGGGYFELKKETGIGKEAVLYRLWQLRGVFPDIYLKAIQKHSHNIKTYMYLLHRSGCDVVIIDDWGSMTFGMGYNGKKYIFEIGETK